MRPGLRRVTTASTSPNETANPGQLSPRQQPHRAKRWWATVASIRTRPG